MSYLLSYSISSCVVQACVTVFPLVLNIGLTDCSHLCAFSLSFFSWKNAPSPSLSLWGFLLFSLCKEEKQRSNALQLYSDNCVCVPRVGHCRGAFSPCVLCSALTVMLLSSRMRVGAYLITSINPCFYLTMGTNRKGREGKWRSLHTPTQMKPPGPPAPGEADKAREWHRLRRENGYVRSALGIMQPEWLQSNTDIPNSQTFSAVEEAFNRVRSGLVSMSIRQSTNSLSQDTQMLVLVCMTYVFRGK